VLLTRRVIAALSASLLLIGGSAAAAQAAPINVPWSPDAALDSEVEFTSGDVTYYGSFRAPVGEVRGAALLLPGSGPTDRNGNQDGITPNTLAYTADVLAERGVATLRYDKFGSGRTGMAGLDPADSLGYTDQVDTAEAALNVLRERTGVASEDLAVLGHSEGSLTTLSLKDRGVDFGPVGLLAPPALRYLDLMSLQLNAAFDRAVAGGQMTPEAASSERARLAVSIEALRAGQPLPYPEDPTLAPLGINPINATFLTEIDAVEPTSIAATLAPSTDVLLTCSEKDLNVSCDQIDGLHDALAGTDVEYARFANASHTLGELGPLPATGVDLYLPLPLSSEFRGALGTWAENTFS
jgi:hypothetical protein